MSKDELLRLYKLDYAGELKKWWDRLPTMEQETATEFIKRLVGQGYSQLWVYLAIEKIRKKEGGFFQWKMLLFNPSFQWEITQAEEEVIVYKTDLEKRKMEINKGIEQFKKNMENREIIYVKKTPKKPKKNKYDLDEIEALINDEIGG